MAGLAVQVTSAVIDVNGKLELRQKNAQNTHSNEMRDGSERSVILLTPLMQATFFEFRHRWWVIFSLFSLAFLAYFLDPVNSGAATVSDVVVGSLLGAGLGYACFRLFQ